MADAVLLMAHGAPSERYGVEEYVLHIRHGRPLAVEQMAVIKDRYRQVGGSPLLQRTFAQAEALEKKLSGEKRVYVGMRHSPPFIHETIRQMRSDGVQSFVAICLAPQYSNLTIGAYQSELAAALQDHPMQYALVKSFARSPQLIAAFATQVRSGLQQHPEAFVLFTAHSLPARVLKEGDPYDHEVKETARLVANAAGLKDWRFAYQSQGMTSEPWLGPAVEGVIDALAAKGTAKILVAPIGFVCDHVEILYDIDVQFQNYAREKGIDLQRTTSLNDAPAFIELLALLVRDHS